VHTLRDAVTGLTASTPLIVQQRVAAIDVAPITFDALGDAIPISAVARDRLGSVVDSASLVYSISDSSAATFESGNRLRSLREGQVILTARDPESSTVATANVTIQQRVTALQLSADTLSFDALTDSVPIGFTARDRLGNVATSARVAFVSTNPAVITLSAEGAVKSVGNGAALVIGESEGAADTVRIHVLQRVAGVVSDRDSVLFESLAAVQALGVMSIDRLRAPVRTATVQYAIGDSSVATVDSLGQVRAVGNGETRVTASTEGYTLTMHVRIAQRAVRVSVPDDTVRFQSLNDTMRLTAIGVDSLGSPVPGNITSVTLGDTTIADMLDPLTLRARRNGVTTASVTVVGISRSVGVVVDQVAASMQVAVTGGQPIVTLSAGARAPISCVALDRNGAPIDGFAPDLNTTAGTVTGRCGSATITRSGVDTIHIGSGAIGANVAIAVAVTPHVSSLGGDLIELDSFPYPGNLAWAPTAQADGRGNIVLYFAAYSPQRDSSGYTRADLHRAVSSDGIHFHYDTIALAHNDSICSQQGQGIENVVVLPRADGPGLRMLYAAGSNACWGWQVFSAVSTDGRIWSKEPGVRMTNGSTSPKQTTAGIFPPWPVGEGMHATQLPSGEWQVLAGGHEQVLPAQDVWQIVEWRSTDQINWRYVGPVLTTREMPADGQGAVYSPVIRQIGPGIWRLMFGADNRNQAPVKHQIWSAVSTDLVHWHVEGALVGDYGSDVYYVSEVNNRLYFVRTDSGGGPHLATVAITMP